MPDLVQENGARMVVEVNTNRLRSISESREDYQRREWGKKWMQSLEAEEEKKKEEQEGVK